MHRILRAVGQHALHHAQPSIHGAVEESLWLVVSHGRASTMELLHARRFSDKPAKRGLLTRLWNG